MKLACQEGLVPGSSLPERLEKLAAWGYKGIEFWGGGIKERVAEIQSALKNSPVQASTICAGFRGCLLDADPAQRDLALQDIRDLLYVAGDIGAVGLIVVPIFGGPRIPDLRPLAAPESLERELLLKLLEDLVQTAEKAGAHILLEPLNRYETHFLRRLEQAAAICDALPHPNLKIMADFFHMSIEEADIAAALRAAGNHIAHVHLADSNRLLPGQGHTDFRQGFAALREIGYTGYMALECGIAGDPAVALPKTVGYLQAAMEAGDRPS
ncbi:MAG: sugar phosphate isomerase/epimerase [Fimbriimonadales bacterium]|nr:sugar phosphate isomerase/epimerase [Fimbriimonadales bacterium]